MCGRYVPPDEAALEREAYLGARNWSGWIKKRWVRRINTAPTMQVPVVIGDELTLARWGLIPTWWKKDTPPALSFNARSEEAAEKPMWRGVIKSQRCIMPAVGWFEWCEHEPARAPNGKPCNQPYFIRAEDPVVMIAGLWSTWVSPAGGEVLSCALLTREAEGPAAHIHHRMPVVLRPDELDVWVDPKTRAGDVQTLIRGSRSDFRGYRVSTRVNNAKNEDEHLLEEVAGERGVP